MFTGIIEELGTVVAIDRLGDSARLSIRGATVTSDAAHGDSLVDYESEDAAARFNYRKLTGGKRIVSEVDYKAKNAKPPSHYFRTNLFFTIETEEAELGEAVAHFGASQFLWRVWDTWVIDGTVNLVGATVSGTGALLRLFQTGYVGTYAFWLVIGVLVILGGAVWRGHP